VAIHLALAFAAAAFLRGVGIPPRAVVNRTAGGRFELERSAAGGKAPSRPEVALET
jgi:hypothetical protein